MRVTLDLRKSVDENAQRYFETAKKARRKALGAEKAVAEWTARAAAKQSDEQKQVKAAKAKRRKDWYESFRWCVSSDGFLLVGGRDATTNELLIKKHAQKGDVVFHTDMAGSPFVIVKAEGKDVPAATLGEAAQFTASFSRAWKNGLSALEVFHVSPEQVTKEPNPGEYLAKGAFMIRGKTLYYQSELKVAIGLDDKGRVMAGPPSAVLSRCAKAVEILQGNEKPSDVAKALQKQLGGDLDDILAGLPPGGCKAGKRLA